MLIAIAGRQHGVKCCDHRAGGWQELRLYQSETGDQVPGDHHEKESADADGDLQPRPRCSPESQQLLPAALLPPGGNRCRSGMGLGTGIIHRNRDGG
jgi:hypothetical protein